MESMYCVTTIADIIFTLAMPYTQVLCVYYLWNREDAVVALWEREAENFDANRYMNMASQGPVAFLFIAMTSRMFEVT
jgi:hypothetical protein